MSEKLIDDIINMLDNSMENGCGHINVKVDEDKVNVEKLEAGDEDIVKTVETLGCTNCSK